MKTQTTDREALQGTDAEIRRTVNWTSSDVEAAVMRERERCLRIVEQWKEIAPIKIIEMIRNGTDGNHT